MGVDTQPLLQLLTGAPMKSLLVLPCHCSPESSSASSSVRRAKRYRDDSGKVVALKELKDGGERDDRHRDKQEMGVTVIMQWQRGETKS